MRDVDENPDGQILLSQAYNTAASLNQLLDIGARERHTLRARLPSQGGSAPILGLIVTVEARTLPGTFERSGFLLPGDLLLFSCARLGDKPYPTSGVFLSR